MIRVVTSLNRRHYLLRSLNREREYMIHVVTSLNRRHYARAIEDHHFIRYKIFVEERGWQALARPDGRDMDAFDTEDTIYILAMDGDRVVGGHRLFPTLQPHMISEIFPHLVTRGPIPRGPNIYEWSRFFVVKEYRSSKVFFELLAAVQEFCLNAGIVSVTAVIEMWWLPRFHEAGLVVHPLGLPQPVENVPTLAIQIDMRRTRSTTPRTRQRCCLHESPRDQHHP